MNLQLLKRTGWKAALKEKAAPNVASSSRSTATIGTHLATHAVLDAAGTIRRRNNVKRQSSRTVLETFAGDDSAQAFDDGLRNSTG